MLIKQNAELASSEITPESVCLNRRHFMGKSLHRLQRLLYCSLLVVSVPTASCLRAAPWPLTIEGEVDKPGAYTLENILQAPCAGDGGWRLRA